MTEPIKQEIINNIFENGDKLITGPILQTVLIDMIDDVNVKDQEILSKTGSWDNAATQIPNLATKEEVTNLSESVARDLENVVDVDLTGYATETWVQNQGYLKEHQDISNLATKTELTEAENNLQGNITSLSESVARDLASVPEGVATEAWVQSQGYLTEHQDISGLATKTELTEAKDNLQGNITSLSESVARDLANVDVDLTGYATEQWVESKGYLTEHQDISNLATKVEVTSLSESVARDLANVSVPEGVATEQWVQSQDYASKSYVNEAVSSSSVDLTGYATETWVQNQGYLTEHQDISNLATKSELTSVSQSVQTDITNLSESVANSAVWKKGTGTDSIVQKLTDANEANTPTATGVGAIALGFATTASGNNSHAEGQTTVASGLASHAEGNSTIASAHCSHAEGGDTKASGSYSHAEGIYTVALGQASHTEGFRTTASKEGSHAEGEFTIASGSYSHAEGGYTLTSNQYEHAQGQYNHNSTNQIFSVGAGEKIGETVTRRNAVSILEVPNSDTQINTASVFVQNIGGYDGTNPIPGTNDLATVINGMSTGGGSSETLWKKGEGTDSIVQVIADGTDLPTATGRRAVAIGSQTTADGNISHAEGHGTNASGNASHAEGFYTKATGENSHAEGWSTKTTGENSHAEGRSTEASGMNSHAEGWYANASGQASHAEGYNTVASGKYSHAEGYNTSASNDYEHAQGQYNHSSTNQIFSIGTGNSNTDRRNAVSVLEVDNSGSYTSSFFVQNIGGYDGTNPEPGTNDLATVLNNLSSSGGSSSGGSSETLWKKGTGKDSAVLILTGNDEAYAPTATGVGAIALGFATTASGQASHAEGGRTIASGHFSHAEGYGTVASNFYEHAQGMLNDSSENQIFSVGAGDGDASNPSTVTRRNAISVLAVRNNDSYTASFFVQNIGGYDGTNPTPGTNDLATVINGMSTGGGSSETLWKKGEGTDSIVQVIADGTDQPTATGNRAIATGMSTTASEQFSHAEGSTTVASGDSSHAEGAGTRAEGPFSHAEGYYTTASGEGSHAEGYQTEAPNSYECALGMCNHSSEGQIFSVGAGEGDPFNPFDPKPITRRNAISVLAVPNSDTQINTASVFIQNVGGYDGTNPLPGTNDLATVISNLPSGGTSSETWTFTLEDGSTVTKNIVMR